MDLLERDDEFTRLEAFVDGIGGSGPRLGFIEGAAGIGKTSLLDHARELLAGSGVRTLSARGSELERDFAFGVVRQLLEPEVRAGDLFKGAAEAAKPVFDAMDSEAGGEAGFSTLHGLYWLVMDIAGDKPVALVIDDLHWVDSPSIRFLAYLVRRLEGAPVVILTAARPNEPGADAQLIAELSGDPLSTVVRPSALGSASVSALISRRLGAEPEPGFLAACQNSTGGNPLLLIELLSALEREGVQPKNSETGLVNDIGPRAVSRSILVRLGRLSAEARAVARAIAVLGDGAELWAIADLADLDERAAGRATGELRQAEILRATQPLGFVHPLVKAAVYDDVAPGERELDHSQAARLLAEAGAAPERIASHLLSVGPRGDAWVVETLTEAGRQAQGRGAAESAGTYLERALAEPPPATERASLTLDLGVVRATTNLPAATPVLQDAFKLNTKPEALALLGNVLGRALLFSGRPADAVNLVRDTATALPGELDDQRLALHGLEAAIVAFGAPSPGSLERLAEWREGARIETLGEKLMAASASWYWMMENGPREDCVRLSLASFEGGDMIEADQGLLPMFAMAVLLLADADEVTATWDHLLEIVHRHGSLFGISTAHLWLGYTLYLRGDLAAAESSLREAVDSFRLYGYQSGGDEGAGGNVYLHSILSAVLREKGDLEGARATLEGMEPPGKADVSRYWFSADIPLLLAEDKAEEAIAAADQMATRVDYISNVAENYWRSYKALALSRLGRTQEAIALARDELELARDWGAPATIGRVLLTLGIVDGERRLEHLGEAVEELGKSSHKLQLAKALFEQGRAIRLDREPTAAREPLARALELAEQCGAEALVKEVRAELGAAGARPRTSALSGVESLTPSERRVADFAAQGLSNREIAQELYVTPKTVEVHLSNTYRKLGIDGRRRLAAAMSA